MKPSLTPCSFSNFSWNFLRMSISGAMLTSLKVVRMALVDCDCTRRSAMRARRRDIGTRCSGRSPRFIPVGADTVGSGLATAATTGAATAGAGAALGAAAPAATAPSTSPLVTRPSLPVPGTEPDARLLSAISLAAAGMATPALLAEAGAAAAGAGRRGSGRSRCRRCRSTGLAFGVDAGDQLITDHRGAIGLHQFGQHTGTRRRHFEHDLVGLDLDQDLVHRHGVAGLLLPLQQGGLGNRFGQLRDLDFYDSHDVFFGVR